MTDKADGVGQGVDPAVGGRCPPGGRVQCRKECVIDEHAGAREAVEQARFSGIGVPDDGNGGDLVTAPLCPLGLPGRVHLPERGSQLGDTAIDATPVSLQLGLAGTTTTDADAAACPTTDLPGEIATPAA